MLLTKEVEEKLFYKLVFNRVLCLVVAIQIVFLIILLLLFLLFFFVPLSFILRPKYGSHVVKFKKKGCISSPYHHNQSDIIKKK